MTPENELWRMTQDNHPLSYLRVNLTVAQFDEFIKTYGITPSDGMYIAPADRITVW
jgi:putative endopeptidase